MEMTPEQLAIFRKLTAPTYYGDQDENGVDLSLIRENLKLTPQQRLRKADQISRSLVSMRQRVKRIDSQRT